MKSPANREVKRKRGNLMMRSSLACGLLCATLLGFQFAPASAQGNDSKDAKTYQALANVPEKARSRQNPLEGNSRASAAGGKLFEQHCAQCHGMKAEGGKYGASLLRPEVTQATPGALFWILTNGVVWRGMPVWSKLPEAQRWQIVTFMESLKAPVNNHAEGAAE